MKNNNPSILSFVFIYGLAFLASCTCSMSDSQKLELANNYLNSSGNSIIVSHYGGGDNIYHKILKVEYDCSQENFKVLTIFYFTGQFTGTKYWAKGVYNLNKGTGRYNYTSLDMDPNLEIALNIQNKLTDEVYKGIEEAFRGE